MLPLTVRVPFTVNCNAPPPAVPASWPSPVPPGTAQIHRLRQGTIGRAARRPATSRPTQTAITSAAGVITGVARCHSRAEIRADGITLAVHVNAPPRSMTALLNTTTIRLVLPASCVSEPFVAICSAPNVSGARATPLPPFVIVSANASGARQSGFRPCRAAVVHQN